MNREGADVLVVFAVVHEQRSTHVISLEERRHLQVGILGFPQCPPLALEREGSQRTIGIAIASDAGLEERRVHHRVVCGEGTVAVTTDSQPVAVDQTLGV